MGNELNSGRDSDWFINVIDLISHSSFVKDAGDATVEQVHCRGARNTPPSMKNGEHVLVFD